MASLGNIGNDILSGFDSLVSSSQSSDPLNQDQRNQYKSDGFLLPPAYSADGNGLPYTKVPSNHDGQIKRNIITWFVPEFGTVKMYINPQSIQYADKKSITRDRTKGGFSIEYWGEELTVLTISGTTGSSGIEGINVLHDIYRAEQHAFDGFGLSIAANNAAADLAGNLVNSLGDSLGIGGGLLGGILGADSPSASLASKNIPSLAQFALSVEMYYNGVVYRGYFETMNVTEKATDFNFDYSMTFVVTQKRGYRTNFLPFHRSPKEGHSQFGTPHSFNGFVK